MSDRILTRARQRLLRSTARGFARDVLLPKQDPDGGPTGSDAAATDPTRCAPRRASRAVYEQAVGEGFLRVCLPERVGGEGRGLTDTATVLEEFCSGDADTAMTLLNTVVGLQPIVVGGDRAQQHRLLAPFLDDRRAPLAAFCAAEPDGPEDPAALVPAAGLRTSAVIDGDQWVIEGRKTSVSSAPGWDSAGADLLCVLCYTNPLAEAGAGASVIAVEGPTAGLTLAPVPRLSGQHPQPDLAFDQVSSAYDNAIGEPGTGLALATHTIAASAALVGILGVALARTAFEHTLQRARTDHGHRGGGSRPLIEDPALGQALTRAKARIEAARALSWRACTAVDAALPHAGELAGHAQSFGTDTAISVITDLRAALDGAGAARDPSRALDQLRRSARALPVADTRAAAAPARPLQHLMRQPTYDHLATCDVI